MIAELKSKWLKALRSGRYKQGKSRLRQIANGKELHCCLGVLGRVMRVKWAEDAMYYSVKDNGVCHGVWLPTSLLKKVGLSNDEQGTLGGMNDGGYTFKEIADYIEKQL